MPGNTHQRVAIEGDDNIVVGEGNVVINPLSPAEARLRADLGILLRNVETTWIKGVLEKSFHESVVLELGIQIKNRAVDNPWRMILQNPDQSTVTLPRGSSIKDIFHASNQLLLILGEPGSGKTTTLLQLARDLIAEVDSAFTQPVPVILNLSTWTNRLQPLDDWLVHELNSKYHLPRKQGREWLAERRLLPLLDGLDEVEAENRTACVEKINNLVKQYGLQGLVVCSRRKEYGDLKVRLAFYRAIYIQPLSPEQIDEYLEQAGDQLAGLRAALQADAGLHNLAQSPLILSVMSLAYQDAPAAVLRNPAMNTAQDRRKELFDVYITRMFSRKGQQLTGKVEQTKQRLSWLARNMQGRSQDIFLIEGLQPNWLQPPHWQWIYFFASRLLGGFFFALAFGLYLVDAISGNRIRYALLFGIVTGLSLGLVDTVRAELLRWRPSLRDSMGRWWTLGNILVVWLIIWLAFGHVGSLFDAITVSVVIGVLGGLRGSSGSTGHDIRTVEALHWSWRKTSKTGLLAGPVGGAILGTIVGLVQFIMRDLYSMIALMIAASNTTDTGNIANALSQAIHSPLFARQLAAMPPHLGSPTVIVWLSAFALMGGVFAGLTSGIIETKSNPNEGIRLSLRNAILAGLIVLPMGAMAGIGVARSMTAPAYAEPGLTFGLMFFIAAALWYGGLDLLQHYTLRMMLVLQGHAPANYARFLDDCAELIFLQTVGGGYRFIHRMLLEHFANLEQAGSNPPD